MRKILHDSRTHLSSVNETYLQHARFALMFSGQCFKAAVMALVHSMVPGIFPNGAGNIVKGLCHKLEGNRRD